MIPALLLLLVWACAATKDGMTQAEYRDAVVEKIEQQDLAISIGRDNVNEGSEEEIDPRTNGYGLWIRIKGDTLRGTIPQEHFGVIKDTEHQSQLVCCHIKERKLAELPNGRMEVVYTVGENLGFASDAPLLKATCEAPRVYRFVFGPWNFVEAEIDGTYYSGELDLHYKDMYYKP